MGLNKNRILSGLRQKRSKNKLAINRDKPLEHTNFALRTHRITTVGACKLRIENTYGRKQNKALSDILSPHIPYKI